jgi:hypothetical protein
MAKIPKYVGKLIGDDVALEDKHAVAHALTLRLQPSPTTVRAGDEQERSALWAFARSMLRSSAGQLTRHAPVDRSECLQSWTPLRSG